MVSYGVMPPDFANGKICYIDIPATDVRRSSDFYAQSFGWKVRERGDGSVANGGEIVQPIDPGAREITALFRDPAGNVLGLYQQPA